MIITENREKVKRKALSLINRSKSDLSKPEKKFILEMIMGMLLTGSSNLTEISRSLKEGISIKDTLKRLGRMLSHDHILDIANNISLFESRSKVNSKTILALDSGDITHQYGKKFEKISCVRDGSSKSYNSGYLLNQITGYNPSTKETFPLSLDIYSVKEKGFDSANAESLNLVNNAIKEIGKDGLWVMDRGYDSGIIFKYFLSNSLDFMVRMKSTRDLILGKKRVNIRAVVNSVNRRVKYSSYSRFGNKKVVLRINGRDYPVTLICLKDRRNKEPIYWLSNGWIKSTVELKRRIRGYFKRWSIEESYRFEKQGFGIEKATVRRFGKIKTLLGLTIMSWLLLIRINETPKLKEMVLKNAKMEKNKRKHRPKFIYYRLLKGVRNLFEGIKELFRFRLKRKEKKKLKRQLKRTKHLFPEFQWKMNGLEI